MLAFGPIVEFLLAYVFNCLLVVDLVLAGPEVEVFFWRFQDFSASVGLIGIYVGVVQLNI